jgi:P-type Ca2+ transporter type 2C
VPGLREVLQVEPISAGMWLALVPFAATVLLLMECDKLIRRQAHPIGPPR